MEDPGDDSIRIAATELIPAVDRATRSIIIAIDAAVKRLEDLGYDRKLDDIRIVHGDSLFPGVMLRGRHVFGIVSKAYEGRIVMDGMWFIDVRPLGRLRRWWRRRSRA